MENVLEPKEIVFTEEMFATGKPARQGEVYIWMKKYAPKGVLKLLDSMQAQEMKLANGKLVLGHSETGHHHVLEAVKPGVSISKAAQALIDQTNDMICDLRLNEQCRLVHMREGHKHITHVYPAGEYIRVLREEQRPEGWQKSQD